MLQSNNLRTISRSRRSLATAIELPLNAHSSTKTLGSNRRPYHVTRERLYEARRGELKTNWQRVENKDCRCQGDCMSGLTFLGLICATSLGKVLAKVAWTDESIRREEEERLDSEEARRLGRISRLCREVEPTMEEDV